MNILLASVNFLPKLVNGKVAVINNDGTYTLYNPSKGTIIKDDFDPMCYSILVHPKYCKCIVSSCMKDKEHYWVNKQIKELKQAQSVLPYRIGDKIHVHYRRGTYSIVAIDGDYITITCNKWQYDENPLHRIHKSEFAALAGGLNNHSF